MPPFACSNLFRSSIIITHDDNFGDSSFTRGKILENAWWIIRADPRDFSSSSCAKKAPFLATRSTRWQENALLEFTPANPSSPSWKPDNGNRGNIRRVEEEQWDAHLSLPWNSQPLPRGETKVFFRLLASLILIPRLSSRVSTFVEMLPAENVPFHPFVTVSLWSDFESSPEKSTGVFHAFGISRYRAA